MTKNLFILFLFFTSLSSFAQEIEIKDSTLYLVEKSDGGEYYGYIVSDDGREILLSTKSIGKLYIQKSEIDNISTVKNLAILARGGTQGADYRNVGPFTTRNYLSSNAIPLKKKENYAIMNLYGPEVHFGVTDRLSLGLMTTWIGSPVVGTAQFNIISNKDKKIHLALNTAMGSSGYLVYGTGFFGAHWLSMTKGNARQNITLSLGYAYSYIGEYRDFDNSLGRVYSYDYYSNQKTSDQPQYATIPHYSAYVALERKLNPAPNYVAEEFNVGTNSSVIFGLSASTPAGQKASFILDAMSSIRPRQVVEYTDQQETVSFIRYSSTPTTETYTIGKGQVVKDGYITNTLIMPAMRINTTHNKAFQVALAGLFHLEKDNTFVTPVPVISWMRQL